MKKRILIMVMSCVVALGCLVGCGEEKNIQECFFCEEEKECETKTMLGEDVNICDDCIEEWNELYN